MQLARQYPHIRPALLISRQLTYLRLPSILLRRIAAIWPDGADMLAGALVPLLDTCEKLRMRETWPKVMAAARPRLLAGCAPRNQRLGRSGHAGATAPAPSIGTVDLANGRERAGEELDDNPVQGAILTWHGLPLGRIEPQAGAEPVCMRHLEGWLCAGGALAVAHAQTLEKWLGTDADAAAWRCDPDLLVTRGDEPVPSRPAVVWEADLAQGVAALQPLMARFSQKVLVRHAGRALGWLDLEEQDRPRSLGEVIYALFTDLDLSAFTPEW